MTLPLNVTTPAINGATSSTIDSQSVDPFAHIDRALLAKDLDELRDELVANIGDEDRIHLLKMQRWIRGLKIVGYATAWIAPNPITVLALAQAKFSAWGMIGHHILHKGYDRVEGLPEHYHSTKFANGPWRRFRDWFDWMPPSGWHREHNVLHHYRLGETNKDPDLVEDNLDWLRTLSAPVWLRKTLLWTMAALWKPFYYAPACIIEREREEVRRATDGEDDYKPSRKDAYSPFSQLGRKLWTESWLPLTGWNFIAIPLLFLPLGPWAVASVLINQLLAEVATNLQSFVMIVPNHAGDDIYRFDSRVDCKGEFYLHQITGSANMQTGSDLNDFAHGFLNYQIEHHLWPDLPMRKYQQAHKRVKAIAARHNIPYAQESVFKRVARTVDIAVGKTSMRRQFSTNAPAEKIRERSDTVGALA